MANRKFLAWSLSPFSAFYKYILSRHRWDKPFRNSTILSILLHILFMQSYKLVCRLLSILVDCTHILHNYFTIGWIPLNHYSFESYRINVTATCRWAASPVDQRGWVDWSNVRQQKRKVHACTHAQKGYSKEIWLEHLLTRVKMILEMDWVLKQ